VLGISFVSERNIALNEILNITSQVRQPVIAKTSTSFKKLTKRERQCLKLTAQGLSAKEIAAKLFLSKLTVENHLDNIKAKFFCKNKIELLTQAIKLGYVNIYEI